MTKINLFTKTLTILIIVFIYSCLKTPEACFTVDKGKTAKINEEVQFDAACSVDATSYSWDFGDGTNGIGVSTKHKYRVASTYVVVLIVNNGSETVSISKNVEILP
jgi:PKD repeat protein